MFANVGRWNYYSYNLMHIYSIFEGQYLDDDLNDSYTAHNGSGYAVGGGGGDEETVRRKTSNEFSPSSVTQQLDSWGANFMELFSDGSRKGSTSNLQPLGKIPSL